MIIVKKEWFEGVKHEDDQHTIIFVAIGPRRRMFQRPIEGVEHTALLDHVYSIGICDTSTTVIHNVLDRS